MTGAGAAAGRGGAAVLADPELPDDEPRRRLSVLRVLAALLLLTGVCYGGFFLVRAKLEAVTISRKTWFAPYVDVTLPPSYQFQSTIDDPARQSVLGFVVSAPSSPCTPSWGASYTLAQANQSLTVGTRIAQMEQDGAQAIVSFGGQSHTSLDVGCTSLKSLAAAYQAVITQYHLSIIDLDIEGAALNDFRAEQRRAAAVAALQRAARAAHRHLDVWLTLPAEPTGLQDNALSVIESMLRQRVSIAGVNIMTMDFTRPPGQGATMLQSVEAALTATRAQLAGLLPRYGIRLAPPQIWQRLGATVMIGQNNVNGERFTIPDAAGLTRFAIQNRLARLSMWSLNRDSQCGSSFPEIGLMSNSCSGTAQSHLGFAGVFDHASGAASRLPSGILRPPKVNKNPADAPFPRWSPTQTYPLGYKVAENGEIFQAKWYNTGQDPAQAVQFGWQTPWEMLGPVLPGDHAPVIPRLPPGTYPAWSRDRQYPAQAQVLYAGLPYQARWANQGIAPGATASSLQGSPWQPLYRIPGEPVG